MDSDSSKPLTIEEAKARLREAADRASPSAWFQRHHLGAIVLAVASGFVISRMRFPVSAGTIITRWVAPLLLGNVVRGLIDETDANHKTSEQQRDSH